MLDGSSLVVPVASYDGTKKGVSSDGDFNGTKEGILEGSTLGVPLGYTDGFVLGSD